MAVREEPEGSGGRLHHSVPFKFATTEEERASLTTAGVHSGATGILMQSSNLWMTDAKVRELMLCPKIGKMIADLMRMEGASAAAGGGGGGAGGGGLSRASSSSGMMSSGGRPRRPS